VTSGGSADINNFTNREHLGDFNFLLEQTSCEINLSSDVSTVDLDLKKICNLLSELQLANLGVGKNADDLAVLFDTVKFELNFSWLFSSLLSILGKSLPLGSVPVLVKATFHVVRQVVRPNSGKSAKAIGCFDVSNDTDGDHRRGLEDGDSLNGFLLVKFGARTLDFSYNVGHTRLVSDESSEVRR